MAPVHALRSSLATARRTTRRRLVIAAFLSYPTFLAIYASLVAPGRLPPAIWAPIAVVLLVLTFIGLAGVYGYARGRAEPSTELDEREAQLRDRAIGLSYAILVGAVTAIVGGLAVYASFIGPISIDMGSLGSAIIAIGLYLPALPSAALAWIEPDPPAEMVEAGR